jgi:hypothetical protein
MPRKATPLTDSAIKAAKPKEKPYKLTDGQGLYLEVMPNGSKLWRMKYRHADKEKRLAFGAYPALPLIKARQKRSEAREQLTCGIDPGEQKKADKQAQKITGATFETLVARGSLPADAPCNDPINKDITRRFYAQMAAAN